MRIQTLVAGACAAALIPTVALAQQTCEQRQSTRVVGTLAGAGIGALAGSAIAGHGDRGQGAVIGGVAGALIGNQATKGQPDCARAYGFYDNHGDWHANTVAQNDAAGYFDRNGTWVEGAPRGYYARDGQWTQTNSDASTGGYYVNNLWVPASAGGYYTQDGLWVATASGHYDQAGRWVAGPTTGRYNADGRWMAGQASGRRDANGAWIADPQPGYYDNGRWVRGEAVGYYDARGQWMATDGRAQRADYRRDGHSDRDALSIDDRQARLAERINRGEQSGKLSRSEVRHARQTLASIERQERSLRTRQGYLGPRGQAIITARLDGLSQTLRTDVSDIY